MKTAYYFTALWCAPCKRTRPLVEQFNNENSELQYTIIDVDDHIELSQKYNISSVPTFILIENEVEIRRMVGAKTPIELKAFLDG